MAIKIPKEPDRTRVKTYIIAGVCGLALIVALSLAGLGLYIRFSATNAKRAEQSRINIAVCTAAADERTALRSIVLQADRALGTPKSAGYTYYRDHPDELAAAHRQSADTLRKYLPTIICDNQGKPLKVGGNK